LEEVVITAERRTESLQNRGIGPSVPAITAAGRSHYIAGNLEDIPGVTGGAAAGISGVGTDTPNGRQDSRHLLERGGRAASMQWCPPPFM
jgi:hypothetical protein